GQIRLPGIGPLVTSSAYGARYASGWVPAPMPAFVSRGLGVTTLPFRFACPAEVVVLDLVPA
ncbi:MAG TPA: metallophosphoesterase, partial [Trueperaceae bacterium]|nr:metallophosphoesterase [Trueperaceae bacterium]